MIRLPAFFAQILATSAPLEAAVRSTCDTFAPWLEQSGMRFFPAYTDHSPRHVNDVLQTAASLISDASRPLITAQDIGVLCIGVLLHDCAHHITPDSFRALVKDERTPIISGLGDKPWHLLWIDFLSEAQRFGDQKLKAIFGSAEPYRTDLLDLKNLTERDCLLIGEFLRRHHARLAHEIAVDGVPSASKERLRLTGFDKDFADMAGLVARSHGMPLRATFEYITEHYGLVAEYRGAKLPYLMAVLRIADYVQVQSERANATLLKVKEIHSPVSRNEWRAHFAVKDVSTRHDDPEALYVHAMPDGVATYVKLTTLLRDIQRELDDSWATLGEVYGRRGELGQLGLSIRRIRSNLETEPLARSLPFIPVRAHFNAAGADLLKLLVGPLYGHNPAIAVRELIQNATDACSEREDVDTAEWNRGAGCEADVIVELIHYRDGTGSLTVTDRGVGMTIETVTSFFLVAGASFRNSDIWKRQHLDGNGHARLDRGGRFGIGVLAAFLCGQEITVTTRHFSRPENEGLRFTARLEDPLIELRHQAAPVGTRIEVRIEDPRTTADLLPNVTDTLLKPDGICQLDRWPQVDWFYQRTPRILYRCVWREARDSPPRNDARAEFRPRTAVMAPARGKRAGSWSRLRDATPYQAIFWRFAWLIEEQRRGRSKDIVVHPERIIVNGILVAEAYQKDGQHPFIRLEEDGKYAPSYTVSRPSMAIVDTGGICPLNLQRNAIAFDQMETEEPLARAVLASHVRSLSRIARSLEGSKGLIELCNRGTAMIDVRYHGNVAPFCATRGGYTLVSPKFLAPRGIDTLIFVHPGSASRNIRLSRLKPSEALMVRQGSGSQAAFDWYRGLWKPIVGGYRMLYGIAEYAPVAATSLMNTSSWKTLVERHRLSKEVQNRLRHKPATRGRGIVLAGDPRCAKRLAERMVELAKGLGPKSELCAWKIRPDDCESTRTSMLQETWIKELGGPLLRVK